MLFPSKLSSVGFDAVAGGLEFRRGCGMTWRRFPHKPRLVYQFRVRRIQRELGYDGWIEALGPEHEYGWAVCSGCRTIILLHDFALVNGLR